jgi:two-component system osmolarity sensor histidine kinase EnvZ
MVSTPNDREPGALRALIGHALAGVRSLPEFAFSYIAEIVPTGLFARALIIIIAPIVLLEGVIAYIFLESHWQSVTRRLSEATARDVAALVELYETYDRKDDYRQLTDLARDRLNVPMQVLPAGDLPSEQPRPFFSLLDRTLSNEISQKVGDRRFWIDTVGRSKHVEIKIQMDDAILRFITRRSQTYASNSHIFLVWMVVTSIILLSVAILFLRNQIKPILRLAEAADAFGRGQAVSEEGLRPRGAREVRQATEAFSEMQARIVQHVEQRTTMLAGVSHDLRTVLTRFQLQLAFLDESPEVQAMRADVRNMEHMLEDYLAFSRGDGGEEPTQVQLGELLAEIQEELQVTGKRVELKIRKSRRPLTATVKRNALKRAITNLASNAARYGDQVVLRAVTQRGAIRIEVEDNGPGIPAHERDNVFKPFYRVDHARNQSSGNSGLGLAIARDIARGHGGEITLGASTLGGLKATLRLPA